MHGGGTEEETQGWHPPAAARVQPTHRATDEGSGAGRIGDSPRSHGGTERWTRARGRSRQSRREPSPKGGDGSGRGAVAEDRGTGRVAPVERHRVGKERQEPSPKGGDGPDAEREVGSQRKDGNPARRAGMDRGRNGAERVARVTVRCCIYAPGRVDGTRTQRMRGRDRGRRWPPTGAREGEPNAEDPPRRLLGGSLLRAPRRHARAKHRPRAPRRQAPAPPVATAPLASSTASAATTRPWPAPLPRSPPAPTEATPRPPPLRCGRASVLPERKPPPPGPTTCRPPSGPRTAPPFAFRAAPWRPPVA